MRACSGIGRLFFFLAVAVALFAQGQARAKPECDAETRAGAPPAINITVDDKEHAVAARSIAVHWNYGSGKTVPCDAATFLLMATPAHVRLAGEGFFALPAGGAMPFGISGWGASTTTVIVPLHLGRLTRSGTLLLTSYKSGPLPLRWKIVSVAKDGVGVVDRGTQGSTNITVAPGEPLIAIQDPVHFSGVPKRVSLSPDRAVRIEDYGNYFRLVDEEASEEIFQAAGTAPAFSPTGRFVYFFSARSASGGSDLTALHVFDRGTRTVIISRERGEELFFNTIVSLRWGLGDAILSLGMRKGGVVETYSTLIDREPFIAGLGASADDAIRVRAKVHINLDNLTLSYTSDFKDPESKRPMFLAFSEAGAMQAVSPKDYEKLAELIRKDEADSNLGHQSGDGGESRFSLESALSGRLQDYVARHDVSRSKTNIETLQATSRWDVGGHQLTRLAGSQTSGRYVQPRSVSNMDQLAAREFLEIPRRRVGSMRNDRFAQRLFDLGLSPQQQADKKVYVAPLSAINKTGRWLMPALTGSLPNVNRFVDQENICIPSVMEWANPDRSKDNIPLASVLEAHMFTVQDIVVWLVAVGCTSSPAVSDFSLRLAVLVKQGNGALNIIWLNEKSTGKSTVHEALGLAAVPYPAPSIGTDLYDHRHLLVSLSDRPEVLDYDLITGTVLVVRGGSASYAAAAGLYRTSDGKIIRLDRDGGIHFYSPQLQREYLSGRYVDDEIVVYDEVGFYDGTDEGSRYVYLRFPGVAEMASLRQYRGSLHRADMLTSVVTGTVPNAVQRPKLLAPPRVESSVSQGKQNRINLEVRATSESELTELRVFIDGRLVRTEAVTGVAIKTILSIGLTGSALWITVQAVDRSGTESAPVALPIPSSMRGTASKPRLHVVAVGTDKYDDPLINKLTGAAADARSFVALVGRSTLYASEPTARPIIDSRDLRKDLLDRLA